MKPGWCPAFFSPSFLGSPTSHDHQVGSTLSCCHTQALRYHFHLSTEPYMPLVSLNPLNVPSPARVQGSQLEGFPGTRSPLCSAPLFYHLPSPNLSPSLHSQSTHLDQRPGSSRHPDEQSGYHKELTGQQGVKQRPGVVDKEGFVDGRRWPFLQAQRTLMAFDKDPM